jgi:hypothetical protein
MRGANWQVVIVAVLLSMTPTDSVLACGCLDGGPLAEQVKDADAVFVGRVVALRLADPEEELGGTVAVLRVERRWKGAADRDVEVETCGTGVIACTCSVTFLLGERYVVFARGQPLTTNSCMSTDVARTAGKIIKQLDKP